MNCTIPKINAHQFIDKILIHKADALVTVNTPWNGSSQLLCNTLKELSAVFHDQVQFYQIDHDEDAALASTYRVDTIPTLLFFKKGALVDKVVGLSRKTVITSKLSQIINRN